MIGLGNGNPLQYSCLENPMDKGAWWAAVHGVAKSRTRLSDFTLTFHFPALKKEMATHSSVLAWRIPGTGEPRGLTSMGSHRVGHDWNDLAAAAAGNLCGIRKILPGFFAHNFTEKAMAPHSSTLAWKIPWTEKPGGLQSMGSLRVGHNWSISLSLFTLMLWRKKWQPTPVFLPRESQGRRSLVGWRLWGCTACLFNLVLLFCFFGHLGHLH